MSSKNLSRKLIFILLLFLFFGTFVKSVFAQNSPSVLYVPLIGLTSVPQPLSLPKGIGNITYNYAVKNFLPELALTQVKVTDDTCNPVIFITGDDNDNLKLDYSETWRYICTTKLSKTTYSTATATGNANNITATHKAYATVIVNSNSPAPFVSIVNTTKIAYPLSIPIEGSNITFTYRVNNPGAVALSDVKVTDDKCSAMSGKLGDINGNNLLDINEAWIYTCTMLIQKTTTNTVNVTAFANGLKAVNNDSITVTVDAPAAASDSALFDVGISPIGGVNGLKNIIWGMLSGILMVLIIFFFLTRKRKLVNIQNKYKFFKKG